MPSKNKAKRFDRAHSWRVARRKRKMAEWMQPKKRSRAKRPKKKSQK
jgi:hypothetical protein